MEIDKVYEPQRFEPHWAQQWVAQQTFRADVAWGEPSFSLAIPPPNVTGSLHMGHMFEHSIIDAQVRWRRMRRSSNGKAVHTLWLPGTDHAGMATELMVDRQLASEGIATRDLGREKFIARVWHWKAQPGGRIADPLKRGVEAETGGLVPFRARRVDAHALGDPRHAVVHEDVVLPVGVAGHEVGRHALERDEAATRSDRREDAAPVSLRACGIDAHALGDARRAVVDEDVGRTVRVAGDEVRRVAAEHHEVPVRGHEVDPVVGDLAGAVPLHARGIHAHARRVLGDRTSDEGEHRDERHQRARGVHRWLPS